jgi:hypothetical protein
MKTFLISFVFLFILGSGAYCTTPSLLVQAADSTVLSDQEEETNDTVLDSLEVNDTIPSAYGRYLQTPLGCDSFNRESWKKAKKGLDYSEELKKKPVQTTGNSAPSGGTLFSGPVPKFIFVGLLLALLVFVLWKILAERLSNKMIPDEEILSSVEDIQDIAKVPESELERLLREALEKEDYREAIRIYYVSILHSLADKKLIHWKKEKTNHEYLHELAPTRHAHVFKELTQLYERVWYGDRMLLAPEYSGIGPRFKSFSDALKTNQLLEQ